MYTNKAMAPKRASPAESGMKKHIPAARRVQNMLGKVKIKRPRRPKVSIVQTAGQAKRKLIRPKPQVARRAFMLEAPASEKMVEE